MDATIAEVRVVSKKDSELHVRLQGGGDTKNWADIGRPLVCTALGTFADRLDCCDAVGFDYVRLEYEQVGTGEGVVHAALLVRGLR